MSSLIAIVLLAGCGGKEAANVETDAEVDTDADADTDADSDTDSDADSDTDGGGDTDAGDTDAGDTDAPTVGCGTVYSVWPEDGVTDAYYRTGVEWTFSDVEPTAMVTLTELGGSGVAGVMGWSGPVLSFTPDAPLQPLTTYEASVTWCGGTFSSAFTTNDIGTVVPDPTTLSGRTYLLDMSSGRFVEPAGLGPLLQAAVPLELLVGVESASASQVVLLGTSADTSGGAPQQELCLESFDFPGAAFAANPYFEAGPQTTSFPVQGGLALEFEDLFLSGAFAPDGTSIEGGVLSARVDTRPLASLVDPSGANPAAVCALVGTFGITCQPCSTGGDFCLDLVVDNLGAAEVPFALVPRAAGDIASDPACAP